MCSSSAAALLFAGSDDNAPATSSNRSSIRAAIRCTAPINAPGPPPTIPKRSRRFFTSLATGFAVISLSHSSPCPLCLCFSVNSVLSLSFCSRLIPGLLRQAQHSPVRRLIRPRTREIIKRPARRLNNMALNKRRPFRRSLLTALNAALPLQHRPPRKIILRQLGKDGLEIHLPVSRRTKPPRSFNPRLIPSINALSSRRTKLRILNMKHLDPFVVEVDEFQIIKLLQHEMARVIQHIASRMLAHALQKHFKRRSIMQVFAGMDLKAQIDSRFIECLENRPPPLCQLIESRFNQPRGSLRPRIKVRPSQRPRKRNMRLQPKIGRRLRRHH